MGELLQHISRTAHNLSGLSFWLEFTDSALKVDSSPSFLYTLSRPNPNPNGRFSSTHSETGVVQGDKSRHTPREMFIWGSVRSRRRLSRSAGRQCV